MDYPKLQNQPLTAVVAEFRFSPVLQISEKIPQLQEQLRPQYPGFLQRLTAKINLGSGPADPTPMTPAAWIFTSASQRQSVFLEPNRVIFLTADYNRFPVFSEDCKLVLTTVNEVIKLGTLDRVGLRYNDAVDPGPNIPLSEYLIPEVLPAAPILDNDTLISHQYVTAVRTTHGTLQVRALIGRTGLPMMPDMLMIFPVPVRNPLPTEYDTAVLDFDHFWDGVGITFSVDEAITHLTDLHSRAREAFWKITTVKAKNQYWK